MKLRNWQSEAIEAALLHYSSNPHFLCMAVPGAGKTFMASVLAHQLIEGNLVDLVVCFSPTKIVSTDFQSELETVTGFSLNGGLGSKGISLTYQAMMHQNDSFWGLFDRYRVFVIFDEIHHCSGNLESGGNAWGQKIIRQIQGRAACSLALTGTPWRSDSVPISLASYCDHGCFIDCHFSYGLRRAIAENVLRSPKITIIDNNRIRVKRENYTEKFSSFEAALQNGACSYQDILENEKVVGYTLKVANSRLNQLRKLKKDAGGLIVVSSVLHAYFVHQCLLDECKETAAIATYEQPDATEIIRDFKNSTNKWIIAVGMISEGTNIPRLQVCCHLTSVKTELYFRQILGRILRRCGDEDDEGYLFMPTETSLRSFAERINTDIPKDNLITICRMKDDPIIEDEGSPIEDNGSAPLQCAGNDTEFQSPYSEIKIEDIFEDQSDLSDSYNKALNVYGQFRKELVPAQHEHDLLLS